VPLVKRAGAPQGVPDDGDAPIEELLGDLQSTYSQKRRSAARRLAGYPEAAGQLCSAVAAETQESVRVAIFTALIRIGEPAAEGLVGLLASEDAGLRNGAIEALKTMPAVVVAHMDAILVAPSDVRIFGVEILGACTYPQSLHQLIRVIEQDPQLNVCLAAVDALLECGDAEAVGPLHRLLERFPDEPFLEFAVRAVLAHIMDS
jgi:HEAT repeat protein